MCKIKSEDILTFLIQSKLKFKVIVKTIFFFLITKQITVISLL